MILVHVATKPGPIPPVADLVEARLDLDPDADWAGHAKRRGASLLATLRSTAEGGAFDGSPEEAARRLTAAARDAFAVDAERAVCARLAEARPTPARVLASQHGTDPITLPRTGAFAWKVARPVVDGPSMIAALDEARDLARRAAAREIPPAFVVPYGAFAALRVLTGAIADEAGVLSLCFGGDDPKAAAGIVPLERLLDELRLREVTSRARLFGLVGRPPSRSPSPRVHNAAFRALGIDALYLPEADVDARTAMGLPYAGWSVTHPLKEDVAALCDDLDPLARAAGAVNTVVRDAAGRLVGSNTDAAALRGVVGDAATTQGEALVLGGGGYARAAIVALRDAGYRVRVVGSERAARAAAALGAEYGGTDPVRRPAERVVVNATPVGAVGALPADFIALADDLREGALLVDAPYRTGRRGEPLPAGLAARAATAGRARVVHGAELLVAQAVGQVRAFTGAAAPMEALADAAAVGRTVVLAGPRGAGKTTVGRILARRLGRAFVDTDEESARRSGCATAGEAIERHGILPFRMLERREVLRAASRSRIVVALGGGALEDPDALGAVKAAGFVVRLTVEAAEAARRIAGDATPRPRLTDAPDLVAECERLIARREPQYAAVAVRSVATDGRTPEVVADRVMRGLHGPSA